MKLKFSIISLTSCSGCISALISLDIFEDFLEKVDLVYFPFIMDEKRIEECDVFLIEGCVIDDEQIKLLKQIRRKARKVVAFGTCAAFGGILNLSEDINGEPISNYIEIDGIIPGCPPPLKILGNSLINLLENKKIVLPEKNLCYDCPLKENIQKNFEISIDELMDEGYKTEKVIPKCFLEKNILCLGPITRAGCDCSCIKLGIPCEGCMGPLKQDYTSTIINFLSLLNLSDDLRKYKSIFFRFSKPNL
ncbi:MAG: hypothetical protein ACTSYZ_15520 [Candidatus Helarchaeota archaeon]